MEYLNHMCRLEELEDSVLVWRSVVNWNVPDGSKNWKIRFTWQVYHNLCVCVCVCAVYVIVSPRIRRVWMSSHILPWWYSTVAVCRHLIPWWRNPPWVISHNKTPEAKMNTYTNVTVCVCVVWCVFVCVYRVCECDCVRDKVTRKAMRHSQQSRGPLAPLSRGKHFLNSADFCKQHTSKSTTFTHTHTQAQPHKHTNIHTNSENEQKQWKNQKNTDIFLFYPFLWSGCV